MPGRFDSAERREFLAAAGKGGSKIRVAVFGCCQMESGSTFGIGFQPVPFSMISTMRQTLRGRRRRGAVSRAHDEEAYLTVDGQVGSRLETGDAIECGLGNYDVLLIRPPQKTFFDVLRQKLKWGER